MNYIITIEEVVSQDFNVEASCADEAMKIAVEKYRQSEFVLEPGNLVSKQMSAKCMETGEETDWMEF